MTELEVYLCFAVFFLGIFAFGATMHLFDARENLRIMSGQLKRCQELRVNDRQNFKKFQNEVERLRDEGAL